MSRRAIASVGLPVVLSGALLTLPAPGLAFSGGVSPAGTGQSAPAPSAPAPSGTVPAGNSAVSATGNGMTIATRASTFLANQLRFTGSAPAADRGDVVVIERLGHETGWRWAPTVQVRVARGGSFSALWRVNHIGRFAIRAVIAAASNARAAAASPTLTVTIYRAAVATQYGPGLYGNHTACGELLTPRTQGVANRTLKCGTPVAIYYRGRTITVPVIDRGPYVGGVDWDLTTATAQTIGMGGTATIGAVSLPPRS